MSLAKDTQQERNDWKQDDVAYKVDIGKLKNLFEDTDRRTVSTGRQSSRSVSNEPKPASKISRSNGDNQPNNAAGDLLKDRENVLEGNDAGQRFQLAKSLFSQYDRVNNTGNKFSADRKRSASPARPLGENMGLATAPSSQQLTTSLLRPAIPAKPSLSNDHLRRASAPVVASVSSKELQSQDDVVERGRSSRRGRPVSSDVSNEHHLNQAPKTITNEVNLNSHEISNNVQVSGENVELTPTSPDIKENYCSVNNIPSQKLPEQMNDHAIASANIDINISSSASFLISTDTQNVIDKHEPVSLLCNKNDDEHDVSIKDVTHAEVAHTTNILHTNNANSIQEDVSVIQRTHTPTIEIITPQDQSTILSQNENTPNILIKLNEEPSETANRSRQNSGSDDSDTDYVQLEPTSEKTKKVRKHGKDDDDAIETEQVKAEDNSG